jgi:hypothetical protein
VQPARRLFIVVVSAKISHRAQVSPLIRNAQDLFAMLRARADAVKDANRRDEAGSVRIRPPFDSQHVAYANLTVTDSIDRSRCRQWNQQPAAFRQSIEP